MDTFFGGLGAPVMLLIAAFFGVTALLWFLLPFSVFGIKTRLDEQIELLRLIDQQLRVMNRTAAPVQQDAPQRAPEMDATAEPEAFGKSATTVAPATDDSTEAAPPSTVSPPKDRWQRPGHAAPKDNG